MKNIVIVGENGFVGSALVKHFSSIENFNVHSVNRHNFDKCDEKFINADIVINASGNSKKFLALDDPIIDLEQSLSITINVLSKINLDKCLLVQISSVDVYHSNFDLDNTCEDRKIEFDKLSNYEASKFLSEKVVMKYAKSWLIFRLSGMVGENMKKNAIFDLINNKEIWIHPETSLQYIDTEEVSKIVSHVIDRNFKNDIFNISGKGSISIDDISKKLSIDYNCRTNLDQKPFHMEINTEKVGKFYNIRSSMSYVKEFISGKRTQSD